MTCCLTGKTLGVIQTLGVIRSKVSLQSQYLVPTRVSLVVVLTTHCTQRHAKLFRISCLIVIRIHEVHAE